MPVAVYSLPRLDLASKLISAPLSNLVSSSSVKTCPLHSLAKVISSPLNWPVVFSLTGRFGFIFGCPVATNLGIGFVPIRKPGKLPREEIRAEYSLEYGKNTLCMHADAIKQGDKVLIIDDLLATGGTVQAAISLVEQLGGEVVGCAFLIELTGLKGREILKDYNIFSMIDYEF